MKHTHTFFNVMALLFSFTVGRAQILQTFTFQGHLFQQSTVADFGL